MVVEGECRITICLIQTACTFPPSIMEAKGKGWNRTLCTSACGKLALLPHQLSVSSMGRGVDSGRAEGLLECVVLLTAHLTVRATLPILGIIQQFLILLATHSRKVDGVHKVAESCRTSTTWARKGNRGTGGSNKTSLSFFVVASSMLMGLQTSSHLY